MSLITKLSVVCCAWLYIAISVLAVEMPTSLNTPETKGRWVAEQSDSRDQGWQDSIANFTMILRNKKGQTSERSARSLAFEMQNDGDKTLMIFDTPADIKGTAFLTFSHIVAADDQWIYLPALRRVKRIASKNKSGPFLGSTFSYEDLSSFEVDNYSYEYQGKETLNNMQVFVIKLKPLYEYSGYTSQLVYIDDQELRIMKSVYYDRKKALLKTLVYEDYQLYLEKHWRALKMVMNNHQTGKSTDLIWSDYQFKTGLTEADFNKNQLKRAR